MPNVREVRKAIDLKEAAPHPWRIEWSKGGKLFIYAHGETQPISIVRTRKRMTRRELATLQLICDAVNSFRERYPHTR